MAEAYIYDAVRTPRGKGKKDGSLYGIKAVDLLSQSLEAIRDRNGLDTNLVEDVIIGCVTQTGEQSGDVAKTAAIKAGYSDGVAGVTLNRFCGSGLESINQAAAYIMSGQVDLLVAGGVESMSRHPLGSDGFGLLGDPAMTAQHQIIPQGISADLIATLDGFTREDVDNFAVASHHNAHRAAQNGLFNKSIIPVRDVNGDVVLGVDETIRPTTNLEGLGKLKPSFEKMGELGGFDAVALQRYPELELIEHVHHAGNSSGLVDGASVVLIGSCEAGEKMGLKPRARLRSFAVVGTEPTIMLVGPAPASRKALKKAGLAAADIDLFEINEAFAVVPLRFIADMGIDPGLVNVNGGAIALGHPLGATGAMLLGTVLDELERRDRQMGLISLCIGGGMGIATVIERV
ncbi:MAG TPA: acetyl-CoA C-acetyltransferase [Bacteroidetes bacterium]|nr:acetyl-CoA C-acetyltransferase [Bacteroidota bacterium]